MRSSGFEIRLCVPQYPLQWTTGLATTSRIHPAWITVAKRSVFVGLLDFGTRIGTCSSVFFFLLETICFDSRCDCRFGNVIGAPTLIAEACLILNDTLTLSELGNCTKIATRSYNTFLTGINGITPNTGVDPVTGANGKQLMVVRSYN